MTITMNECAETPDIPLFDPAILSRIDPTTFKATYKNVVSPLSPGDNLLIRPLSSGDYDRGYLELLDQLSMPVGDVTREKFLDRFNQMKACEDMYYVMVIEDTSTNQIIGTATVMKEQTFTHRATSRGRLEHVIVNDLYRGKQLGKLMVDILTSLCRELGCYKISVRCSDQNVQFYGKCGYEKDKRQNYMERYFE